jgi:peptide-methionine (S)-S-oxide reductase
MKFLLGMLVVLLTACSFTQAQQAEVPPIRNFFKINQDYCTGGQPRLEHLEKLKAEGVKAIINLRPTGEHRAAEEEAKAKELGLRYINIPVVYADPKDEQADEFLKVMDDPANRPAFIHCAAGIRAGAFWLIRRVVRDGWTFEKAEEEAKLAGLVNAPHLTEFARKYIESHPVKKGAKNGGGKAMNDKPGKEVTTLGGGCFWCTEAVYKELRGVDKVVSGYSGGQVANPSYKAVTTGTTGHAEVIQVTFDPAQISYKELLEVFFTIHDPTTLNRQGADIGTQYRSAIFYHSPEQKAVAEEVMKQINAAKIWDAPIVTEITKFNKFYPAEDYHQNYFELNPDQGYCRVVIAPKVNKFRKQFMSKLKKQAAAH